MIDFNFISAEIRDRPLPAAILDQSAFQSTIAQIASDAERAGKKIRLGTKSLRVPEILKNVLQSHSVFQGLMTMSARESLFLAELGFDDFVIAYPSVQRSEMLAVKKLAEMNKKFHVMIDHSVHVRCLRELEIPVSVFIDVDVSLILGSLQIGARRSSVKTEKDLGELIVLVDQSPQLKISGVMFYDSQVAGLQDQLPNQTMQNVLYKTVRRISHDVILKKRRSLLSAFSQQSREWMINGGGSGSLDWSLADPSLTEVTVGSAFYCPHLFDGYSNQHWQPSLYLACSADRAPEPGWVTVSGGGYVASGKPGWEKLLKPVWPVGSTLSSDEGCGEVQTPVKTTATLGDVVYFRSAKAGEVLERFDRLYVIKNGQIAHEYPTYRGMGQTFL